MRIKHAFIISLLFFLITGCYATITGTVVDSETGEPIDGAVVLVEWTVTKGFGLTYTKSYKVIEAITDKEGKVTVSGVFNPFVNRPPHIVAYKKGYVAWNNEFIFPTWEKRKDFKYRDGAIIKLERFKEEFSCPDHVSFIGSGAVSGSGGKLLDDAYSWERRLAEHELDQRKKK